MDRNPQHRLIYRMFFPSTTSHALQNICAILLQTSLYEWSRNNVANVVQESQVCRTHYRSRQGSSSKCTTAALRFCAEGVLKLVLLAWHHIFLKECLLSKPNANRELGNFHLCPITASSQVATKGRCGPAWEQGISAAPFIATNLRPAPPNKQVRMIFLVLARPESLQHTAPFVSEAKAAYNSPRLPALPMTSLL